jgi:predicted ferric reductase
MHAIGAVAIVVLVAHHALMAGRYSSDPLLRGFWLLFVATALATLDWTYLIAPLRAARRPYKVISVKKVALKTWELVVRPLRHDALSFNAGQFVWLIVGHSPFSLRENPFTSNSAPSERPKI